MFPVSNLKSIFLFIFVFSLFGAESHADRWERILSGKGWTLRLDERAEWINDEIFVPPVDLSKIPYNPPTWGWEGMYRTAGKKVRVPGTVEEYYWGAEGRNPLGIAGDWRGVSWWSRTFTVPKSLRGKRITLNFGAVNLRAEVYVNGKLVGYDVVANTPFEVDITETVIFGRNNNLDVRITDPIGNFSWEAHIMLPWGKYLIPIVRGFGGITGDVTLRATDNIRIDDAWVLNKPTITDADLFVNLNNTNPTPYAGTLSVEVHEWKRPRRVVWRHTANLTVPPGTTEHNLEINVPEAKIWDIYQPNLYVAVVKFSSREAGSSDSFSRRFGFRWFDVGEKDGDKRFYLNGRRIFIRATVNRVYMAGNGMFATPELAKRDAELTKLMGFNTMAFHNAIGCPNLLAACDEYGILSTGESGGYRCDRGPQDEITRALRREKLFRFVQRDRSSPSHFLYMLKNEDLNPPDEDDLANMARIREMDPTRILLYNGDRDRRKPKWQNDPDDPLKLHFLPLDPTGHLHGWWDMHHWNREAGNLDDYYRNPNNYYRYNMADGDSTHKVPRDEVIFYSEEGAFGTMFRLEKMKREIDKKGNALGWREKEHLYWYEAYSRFLDETGFRSSFPTVDHLTVALGRNMHYYHGRNMENARISNIVDAYHVNGWASAATHTDLADAYRFPSSDPSIMAHYNQPLFVAVKVRDKVLPFGARPVADIFLVNELDVNGPHTLRLDIVSPGGSNIFSREYPVDVLGGEEFGQLLVEEIVLPAVVHNGLHRLNAAIYKGNAKVADGFDEIYAVDLQRRLSDLGNVAVFDTSGTIDRFLREFRGIDAAEFTVSGPRYDCIVFGEHNFDLVNRGGIYRAAMEQVLNGARLIILSNPERWAQAMDNPGGYQAVEYWGTAQWNNRGRQFVGNSLFLEGLPKAQAMGWEYQEFYRLQPVWGINMGRFGNETIVALAAQNRKDILTSVARVPFGRGEIFLSTLNILPTLNSERQQSAVPKRLFLNFMEAGRDK